MTFKTQMENGRMAKQDIKSRYKARFVNKQ